MNNIVCAIAKQENRYIYEWAKHHLDIGFAHIHIYDNNDLNGESIADLFRSTPLENKVSIHDVRGKVCMQLDAYQDCYDSIDFDWCAFIDVDEFITFVSPSMCINDFLSDKNDFEAVHLNWLCYGDDEQLASDGRKVRERIKHSIEPIDFKSQYILIPENTHIKSIIRKGGNIKWSSTGKIVAWSNPHTPANLSYVCNELGKEIINSPWANISHSVCFIAHYITKTISEYAVKVQRKAADNNNYNHTYTRFFCYNNLTLRKLFVIKKLNPNIKLLSVLFDLLKYKLMLKRTPLSKFSKKFCRKYKEEKEILHKINLNCR